VWKQSNHKIIQQKMMALLTYSVSLPLIPLLLKFRVGSFFRIKSLFLPEFRIPPPGLCPG
jgi:hypothetical protein